MSENLPARTTSNTFERIKRAAGLAERLLSTRRTRQAAERRGGPGGAELELLQPVQFEP